MGIPMLKIIRSRDHLIFNMEIPILERRHLYIKTARCRQNISLAHLNPWLIWTELTEELTANEHEYEFYHDSDLIHSILRPCALCDMLIWVISFSCCLIGFVYCLSCYLLLLCQRKIHHAKYVKTIIIFSLMRGFVNEQIHIYIHI